MSSSDKQASRQFADDPIRADFRNFLALLWAHLRLPNPTPVQFEIAQYLQHGPRRRMVQAFRGVGKSWITAAYVLWRLYRNPNERVLVVSASKERADSFSVFVKRLIAEWELIEELKPEPGMRDSNIAFDVGGSDPHQAPSVRSVGITGQLTGGRATIIIPDDIEVPKNALTQVQRDKLAEAIKEFDAVLSPGGEIVYLGTPQTEMSVYNKLPERGYDVRVWPARFPKKLTGYGDRLAPSIRKMLRADATLPDQCHGRGAPTDGARFTDLDLVEREASYGRSGFALQFQLDTSLSDANRYPLKLSDLMVMGLQPDQGPVRVAWGSGPDQVRSDLPMIGLQGDRWHRPAFIDREYKPYDGVLMFIDPSGRGADETGYAVVANLNGYLYVLACGGLKGGYTDETLAQLAQIAKRCRVKKVWIESNFGDGMFTKLLTPFLTRIYPCTCEEVRSSVQKEKRIIDTLEPVMNQHRLIFDEKAVMDDLPRAGAEEVYEQKYSLFYQLTRITREKGAILQDDRIDALAGAVAQWVAVLDEDVESIDQRRKLEAFDKALREFSEEYGVAMPGMSDNWNGDLYSGML